ncbi:MAG: hypothetical protein E7486_06050 [Ruminococcaceae bacterium]|nr:hypothetical protein [Oscillospiraceae bacterium]
MSILSILETLFIGPLKLVFEVIFAVANQFVDHPGVAIIFLSLVMNILVLPLYRRADAMQEQARDMDAKLRRGVSHIKKTFSGDERMMILQTYYRQNHYKPTDALRGSVSLLLEIPFFMAAYQFLSHLELLNGVSFGPIADLGKPDGLLVIGGLTVNLLPVVMTLINVVSSAIYLKGFPLKTKIQLYGMALFFLVFLYTSPAGLVFYWTLNNLFSLVKTIFYKLKNPGLVLRILTAAGGIFFLCWGLIFYQTDLVGERIFLAAIGVALLCPAVWHLLRGYLPRLGKDSPASPNRTRFLLGGAFLAVVTGLTIPGTFLAASPQEFVDVTYFHHPLWYLVSSFCIAAGTFLIWMGVFYWLASPKGKVLFEGAVWILSGTMLVNYMAFGTGLGVISPTLQYENGLVFSDLELWLNVAVLLVLGAGLCFVAIKFSRVIGPVLLAGVVALSAMSVVNVVTVAQSVDRVSSSHSNEIPSYPLSKTGKNVVVIMLDRAMGEYVPYLMAEKPELKEQFAGFTYYSNVISFGGYTNFGAPALFGGYEYTPVELNKRENELLKEKHNEALKVMPVLFEQEGFEVTVCDPVYANYQWIPDLSIFDGHDGIRTYLADGKFSDTAPKEQIISNNHRNFFCFSLMKTMPLFLQEAIYDQGRYHQAEQAEIPGAYTTQTIDGTTKANGLGKSFMEAYHVLEGMPEVTRITEQEQSTFLMLCSDLTHEPMLLQKPDYLPVEQVDNTPFEKEALYPEVDGKTLKLESSWQKIHYHTNMAALLRLGEWMDHLRAEGVYDNTRIILVSDHGRNMYQLDQLMMGNQSIHDVEYYFPLLMVKDFGSREFTVSDEFMTNADVPTLATEGIISRPVNPFTGKVINNLEKTAHDQLVILSEEWSTGSNNGTTFHPALWASVKENLWERENWTFSKVETVLQEHRLP